MDSIIRKFNLKEVVPNRYLYHLTNKENRSSILYNGLIPMSFANSSWIDTPSLLYPNSVFANNTDYFPCFFPLDEWLYKPVCHNNIEIWRIDTNECSNIWYRDTNILNSVMTLGKIPPKALKLFRINRDNIETPESLLIYGLMLEDYIYPIDPFTDTPLVKPKK